MLFIIFIMPEAQLSMQSSLLDGVFEGIFKIHDIIVNLVLNGNTLSSEAISASAPGLRTSINVMQIFTKLA